MLFSFVFVIGGSIYAFLENSDINNTDILDTTTGTWSAGDDLPRSRSASGCVVYELNGWLKLHLLMFSKCYDINAIF